MSIGSKIKQLRTFYGLTQEELADRCELTKGYISQLENDLTSPSISTLTDILSALGTNLKSFFNELCSISTISFIDFLDENYVKLYSLIKQAKVLSGGEKVRCMLSKMMLEHGNVLLLDEPTNHLDMESITALDEGLKRFNGCVVFSTYDQHLIDTIATRIVDIKEDGSYLDKEMTYEEYLAKYGNEQ